MNFNPAIVVPAFRRSNSLRRLLRSISEALISDTPDVIISLEGGATPEVIREAERFATEYKNTRILRHEERLGLRNHIIKCADFSLEYGSVIILEDDLMVDPQFYKYSVDAMCYYAQASNIAGFALYSPEYNEFAGLPFRPMYNGFDTYLMRTPCSWGQAWTSTQWTKFRNWYLGADQKIINATKIPFSMKDWPESSWKKYYAAYISANSLDFVYPYRSLATNCGDDGGTHMTKETCLYQVNFGDPERGNRPFHFAPPKARQNVSYDEHMEASGSSVYEWLDLSPEEVAIDLYGIKQVKILTDHRFIATSRLVRQHVDRVALKFRPIDYNIRFLRGGGEAGNGAHISLARAEDIIADNHRDTVAKLTYFSGMNIASVRHGLTLGTNSLLRLPSTLAHHSARIIGSTRDYIKK